MKYIANIVGYLSELFIKASALEKISLCSVALAFIDIFIKPISVTALGFFVLAALPWLFHLVRTLEFPGGLKFELRDLDKIEKEAEKAGLLSLGSQNSQNYELFFDVDPNLALAGLRLEIERRLRSLGERYEIDRRTSLLRLLGYLNGRGALDADQVSVISDLLPTLNRAVHAENLDERAYYWARDIGPQILKYLDSKIEGTNEISAQRTGA